MTILFVGSELEAFSPSESGIVELTTSTFFDAAFSRAAIKLAGGSDAAYVETAAWTGVSEHYLHFAITTAGIFQTNDLVSLYNGSTQVFKIEAVSDLTTVTLKLYYLAAGPAWTQIGSNVTVSATSDLLHFDLYVKSGASGAAALYSGGTLRTSGSASMTEFTTWDRARIHSQYGLIYLSQVAADTDPTIGYRVATYYPSGVGADTAWTGDYSNIDEAILNDADFINSASADQVETNAISGPSLTGYTAKAVTVSARAKRGASGPQNIRMALRSAGTTYFSSGDIALGVGYAPVQTTWATNPATSAAWVTSAIAALQGGVKSIT